MLCNLSVCKTCLTRLGNTNKFVRFKSHYVVLDISQKATQKEIRDAYIKLSKQFHPDQNRHSRRSHDKFVQISQAYEVLGKDSSRREYDQKIASQYPRPTSNPYQSSTRPANYYSSGQFYEDRAYRTGFDPSNPYARRSSDTFRNDPFSDLNYDYSFYQRKSDKRNETSEDDWKFYATFSQKIVWIYTYIMLIPFYIGCFYALHARDKKMQERSKVSRPTRILTREERQAAQEKLRYRQNVMLISFGVFCLIFTLGQIFFDDDYLVQKQDEQASERREEERNPNDNWETDPVIIAFDRIFWAMVIGMILYLLRDVLYSKYLDYNVTSLKEELERRKKLKEHEMARSVIRTISPDK